MGTQPTPIIMVDIHIIQHTIATAIQLMGGIPGRRTPGRTRIGIQRHPIRGSIPIGYLMPDGVDERAACTVADPLGITNAVGV